MKRKDPIQISETVMVLVPVLVYSKTHELK